MLLALMYTFLFLAPLLMVAGPRGQWSNIYALMLCKPCRRRRQESRADLGAAPAPAPVVDVAGGFSSPQPLARSSSDLEGNQNPSFVESNEPQCITPYCTRPTWNGKSGELCCRSCAKSKGRTHGESCANRLERKVSMRRGLSRGLSSSSISSSNPVAEMGPTETHTGDMARLPEAPLSTNAAPVSAVSAEVVGNAQDDGIIIPPSSDLQTPRDETRTPREGEV